LENYDNNKIIDIELPLLIENPSEFHSVFKESPTSFFIVNDEENSNISNKKLTIESEIIEDLGSFPQKFASYENNTFFAEDLLEVRNIDKNNINLLKNEMNYQENLFVFKRVLQMIHRHLSDKSCILSFLREIYLDYLHNKYGEFQMDSISRNYKEEKKILKDLDCFIVIYKEIIMDFYNIAKNLYIMQNPGLRELFSNEAFRYFIINSLFNNEEIYDIAFSLEKAMNYKEEAKFQISIKKFSDLSLNITDFGVSKEYLLRESPLEQENGLDLSVFNYILAIDCVKNLQFIKSPVHKLKSIILCGLMIKKSIEDFYFKLHKKIANDMIKQRDFIRIMFFAVFMSKIPHLITHYKMIKEFLHKNVIENLKLPFFRYFGLSLEFFVMANQIPPCRKIFRDFLKEFMEENDFA